MSMIKKQRGSELAVKSEVKDLSLSKTLEMGQVFAASGMFTDVKTKAEAVVKIYAGRELGIPPVVAMSKLFMVNGKVAIPAVIMGGLIKSSSRYNYRVKKLDDVECIVQFLERDGDKWIEIGTATFTYAEAKLASLTHKDNWTKYRQDMLFARALSRGARRYCPDAINGAYAMEEMDIAETKPITMSDKIAEAKKNAENKPIEAEISHGGDDMPESPETPAEQNDSPPSGEIKGGATASLAKIKNITELRKALPGKTAEDRAEVYDALKLSVGLDNVPEEDMTTAQANKLIDLLKKNIVEDSQEAEPIPEKEKVCPAGYCEECWPDKKKKLAASEKKLSQKNYGRDLCFKHQKAAAKAASDD